MKKFERASSVKISTAILSVISKRAPDMCRGLRATKGTESREHLLVFVFLLDDPVGDADICPKGEAKGDENSPPRRLDREVVEV